MSDFYTDYPIKELGDKEGELAPIRKVTLCWYEDSDETISIFVEGCNLDVKVENVYSSYGRYGNVPPIDPTKEFRMGMPVDDSHKDYLSNTIDIGDRVLVTERHFRQFSVAKVISFANTQLNVVYFNGHFAKYRVKQHKVLVIEKGESND